MTTRERREWTWSAVLPGEFNRLSIIGFPARANIAECRAARLHSELREVIAPFDRGFAPEREAKAATVSQKDCHLLRVLPDSS